MLPSQIDVVLHAIQNTRIQVLHSISNMRLDGCEVSGEEVLILFAREIATEPEKTDIYLVVQYNLALGG